MRMLMVAATAFAAGTLFFAVFRHDAEPAPVPPPTRVTVTKEVPGPTQTVTKTTVPKSCLDLIQAAGFAQTAVQAYEQQVGDLPKLIDDAGTAVGSGDLKRLNGLRQKQIQLEADSIQSLLNIRDAQQRMTNSQTKCQKALKGE
jgi:hypothetical protein